MQAEVISIGTELIIGHTVNTNASYISEKLNSIGIDVLYHTAVGDNKSRIQECLKQATQRSDLIICTGGLGPTDDDITHDVIADFLERKLIENSEQKEILINKFNTNDEALIPNINYRQARVIENATVIPNPLGTAIGMMIEFEPNKRILSFPGVPYEMQAMLESILQEITSNQIILSSKIRLTEISESAMAQKISDHYGETNNPFLQANPSLAPYAELGETYLRITAKASNHSQAKALIDTKKSEIKKLFPNNIYGYDDDTLVSVLANELKKQNLTISFAESCTGGLASKLLTDIPGASQYTQINFVTYSNESKTQILGVKESTLLNQGAVSEECAKEMAIGLTKISNADVNVSITGIAGPDGATEEKPIGTIYVGIIIKGKTGLYINSENQGSVLHEDGFYCQFRQLDWTKRKLTREQVRELACKKVFWLIIKLIRG